MESPYRPEEEAAPRGGAAEEAARGHDRSSRRGRGRGRRTASRCRRCAGRSPSTCSRAAGRRPTAPRSSRSTWGGSPPGGPSSSSRWPAARLSLTYLAFVARATVEALERHPILNASIDGEEIVYHDDVNLGIAVALEKGLIVPVIRQAQRLSLEGMAAAIADVAERARDERLVPDDVHGGTFTITNPGQFGAVLATPIINQPQVAILDLEAIVKRPVVISEGRLRRDRDQADDLSLHVVGPPRPRRRRGGALPRRRRADARGLGGPMSRGNGDRRAPTATGGLPTGSTTKSWWSAGAGEPASTWSSPCTRPPSGPRSAGRGCGTTALQAMRSPTRSGSREAMTFKAAAAGLDLGGGKAVLCSDGELPDGEPPRAACSTWAMWSSPRRALHHRRGRRHRDRGHGGDPRAHLARRRAPGGSGRLGRSRARSPRAASRRRSGPVASGALAAGNSPAGVSASSGSATSARGSPSACSPPAPR